MFFGHDFLLINNNIECMFIKGEQPLYKFLGFGKWNNKIASNLAKIHFELEDALQLKETSVQTGLPRIILSDRLSYIIDPRIEAIYR